MRLSFLICVVLLAAGRWQINAQNAAPVEGDPPVASLIEISPPAEDGTVVITGAPGAVFPAASVSIMNLYTQDIVYATAGLTGAFNATIYGPGITPFWISPSTSIPAALRNRPGSLPGGPGTIIYAQAPVRTETDETITQIIIDGQFNDWSAYPQAALERGVFALTNATSFYIGVPAEIPLGAQLVLVFRVNDAVYELTLDPALPQTGLLNQLAPVEANLGTLAVASDANTAGDAVEVRFAIADINDVNPSEDVITLERTYIRSDEGESDARDVESVVPHFPEEISGIVYPGGELSGDDIVRFSVSGPLAQGASSWLAEGRLERLTIQPGATATLELDVMLNLPELPESLSGLDLIGTVALQPVTIDSNGEQNIAALHTNNGWSNVLTPSGLAVDNLRGDVMLTQTTVPSARIVRRDSTLLAGFRFEIAVPEDLPPGLYVPVFRGSGQIGDGEEFVWEAESRFFGGGPGLARQPLTRLPLVLTIGDIDGAELAWTLFYDDPSDGSRGILPAEMSGQIALSNRVRFNSPTYVLPPGEYPLEPYLLNMMPNAYGVVTAPLVPLLFPGGRIEATVTAPDGTVDELPSAPFRQNRLSTDEIDERLRFGPQTPLDAYRLTTLEPLYEAYPFDQYGTYEITVEGTIDDLYGNRYEGGGSYELVIAEPLSFTAGVLPGMPFEIDMPYFAGGQVTPHLPAEMNIEATLFPLDGSEPVMLTQTVTADDYGFFAPDEPFLFDAPGEYLIDYEVRYTTPGGQLWASSMRSAGVVAEPESAFVAHGLRGVLDYAALAEDAYRPAWYTGRQYPPDDAFFEGPTVPHMPYHPGDVAVIRDGPEGGMATTQRVQDLDGAYANWLVGTVPEYQSVRGLSMYRLALLDALPLTPILGGPAKPHGPALTPQIIANDAYAYISAVRPGVTVRQYVQGSDDDALPLYWSSDESYNDQIGAGVDGDLPGDYIFLFGGGVIRNAEANVNSTFPYAALAIVDDEDQFVRITPPYRGAAGSLDSGPLLSPNNEDLDLIFYPSGTKPGQVMTVGSELIIAGQAGPTLPTLVTVNITSPSGETTEAGGLTTRTGYFYDPDQDMVLDEVGVWTVEIVTIPAGTTAAGVPQPPLPTGTVPGAELQRFFVFVTPEDALALEWSRGGDTDSTFPYGTPFNFGVPVPVGFEEPTAYFTLSTPAYVLDAGTLTVFGSVTSYQFNPLALSETFPIEPTRRGDGPSASDPMTLTFVMTGMNADGEMTLRTRTFTIFHDRLLSFNDIERAPQEASDDE